MPAATQLIEKCHLHEVIRRLAELGTDDAWLALAHLAREADFNARVGEDIARGLISNLSKNTFDTFLGLLKDSTFFRLQPNAWYMDKIAEPIVDAIGTDGTRREDLVSICLQSDSNIAESLAYAVLGYSADSKQDAITFGLQELDREPFKGIHKPAIEMLRSLFSYRQPLSEAGAYEVHSQSCNTLRQQLFARALGTAQSADSSKALLCELEASFICFI